jgi:ABC-type bacteriocin/lantibiotic exporter with double-glycine peptidase domain
VLKRLGSIVLQHRLHFIAVLASSVGLNVALAAVDPLIMKQLMDALVGRDFQTFGIVAAVVVLFGVFIRVGLWTYELLAQSLKNKLSESLSMKMLRVYYNIGYTETKRAESGYFLSRLYDEPTKIAQGAVTTWIGLVIHAVTFIAAGVVAVYLAWRLALLLSLIVPFLYWLANRFAPKITRTSQAENEEEARLREVFATAIGAYTTVKIFALHESVRARVQERMRGFLGILYTRVKTSKSYETLSSVCLSLAEATVLLSAGYEVITGRLTIGGLLGFLSAFWKLIGAANSLIAQLPELAKLDGYIERLAAFERSAHPEDEADFERIELEQVTAGYDGRAVLKDLNLHIGGEEKVLILGPNGSGKSTLAYLMTRFLRPTQGAVRAPRLQRVSALLAPFHFVSGTLKDNVNYAHLDEKQRQFFWTLVEEFGLRDKVDQDPSQEFSEGQKKKAQILMTLLKDADVYIFDEPFANVDSESKEKILKQQLERTKGKILISIMHGEEKFHGLFERIVPLGGA